MTGRISALGRYAGFTEPVANGYERSSRYVDMDDGCRLAVDVLRPTRDGVPLAGRHPTLVQATGYRRSYFFGETDLALVGDQPAWKKLKVGDLVTGYEKSVLAKTLIDHGYNLVCVDLRGTGASFGANSSGMWRNSADIAHLIDWIPTQEWATEKVGMIGISWEGTIQLTTAAYQPRHLTAIAPMATSQGFSAVCDNGLYLHGFYGLDWAGMVANQRAHAPALPVDGNEGPLLMEQALAERQPAQGPPPSDDPLAGMKMVKDTMLDAARITAPPPPMPELGPLGDSMDETDRINGSGTAILLISGWWDITFSGHTLDFFRALTVPKRLLMGPWNHLGPTSTVTEQLRWFDHWLKGIDNGIAVEPCFNFAETDAFGKETWYGSSIYPLSEVRERRLELGTDSKLESCHRPERVDIRYPVDYSTTLGVHSRSRFFFRQHKRISPPDLNRRAERCLRFETSPFEDGVRLIGRPELHLLMKTTGTSGAVCATLEEVLSDGRAHYITEGALNLFHRKVANSPQPHDGRAFHRQMKTDLLSVVPDALMEVAFEFYPVAWRLQPGSRIRLTMAGADADNFLIVEEDPAPVWTVQLGGEPGSHLFLQVVGTRLPTSAAPLDDPGFEAPNAQAFDYLES